MGVAEVCFEVGYESVGTFATRFKDLVGLPPGRMRRLPEELHAALCRVGGWYQSLLSSPEEAGVAFRVHSPDLGGGGVFVGAFFTPVPPGGAGAGGVLGGPGNPRAHPVPGGDHHLHAPPVAAPEGPLGLPA